MRRTFMFVIGILALIEAVFIAESFTTLLGIVVGNGGDFFKLVVLLALRMPDIVDFGLPIALVIALYFALSIARDEGEFIICAAAGVTWKRIPLFVFIVGIFGMIVSLAVSGIVTPVASYTFRIAVYELEASKIKRQVLNPGPTDFIHEIDGKTLISANHLADPRHERGPLFFYQPSEPGNWHVSMAEDWTVQEVGQNGGFEATMTQFRDYLGVLGGFETQKPGAKPTSIQIIPDIDIKNPPKFSSTAIKSVDLQFELDDLIRTLDRGRQNNELPIAALSQGFGLESDPELRRAFAVKAARALLCPAAALFALLAVAASHLPLGRVLALPGAALGVIGLDLVARTFFTDSAALGFDTLVATVLISAVVVFVPALLVIFHFGERIIKPQQVYAR